MSSNSPFQREINSAVCVESFALSERDKQLFMPSHSPSQRERNYCVHLKSLQFESEQTEDEEAEMADEFATVRVAQGALRGRRVAAKAGNSFFSFQGIPYARPPVGPLRFQVAQVAEPWQGVRDALKEGASCPQIEWMLKLPYRGEEDCLFVNVYSPKLPSANETVSYPVMVWIHGGGFEVGSGDTDMYGPEFLVGEDVVVVTFNYRLGIFGFLNVGDIPFNLGLKDQVAALRWIRENVSVFGGDPNNVTIFGESAGACSVNYHLISPMSKGLFKRAIIQSGSVLSPWATNDTTEVAFAVAKQLGKAASNTRELIDFLRRASARDLVEKHVEVFEKQSGIGREAHFRPSPETNARAGDEVFLPAHPRELMEKKQFQSVPCMIGMNSSEGIFFLALAGILKNPEKLKLIGQNFEMSIPKDVISKSSKKEIAENLKKFYFGKNDINETSLTAYSKFMADVAFTRGTDRTVKILSEGTSPVYYYYFDFSGRLNYFKEFVEAQSFEGATHLDELGYLFATPLFKSPEVEPDSRESLTRKRMLKLWTNFAKNGNPTPSLDPVIGVKWPRYTVQNAEYLNIDDTLSVRKNLKHDVIELWNNF